MSKIMNLMSQKDSQTVEEYNSSTHSIFSSSKKDEQEEQDKKYLLDNKKKESVEKMISYLNKANKRGCFELDDGKHIYDCICKIKNEKSTLDELKHSIILFVEALKIANKRGVFEFQESADIYDTCSIFVTK